MHPPAGWHPDPYDPLVDRYWDGRQWTAHTRPKGAADPTRALTPVENSAARDPGAPAKRRKWPWITGAAVVGLLAIGAFGDDTAEQEDTTSVVVTSTAAPTTTPAATTTRRTPPTSTTVAVVPLVPQQVEETTTPAAAPRTTSESYPEPATTEPAYIPPPPTSEAPAYTPPPATFEEPTYAPEQPAEAPPSVYYRNCDAARNAGAAPIYVGEPGYRLELDRNKDGVACEN